MALAFIGGAAASGAVGRYLSNATGVYGKSNLKLLRKIGRKVLPGATKAIEKGVRSHQGVVADVGSGLRAGRGVLRGITSGNFVGVEQNAKELGAVGKNLVQDARSAVTGAKRARSEVQRVTGSLGAAAKRQRKLSADQMAEMNQLAGS